MSETSTHGIHGDRRDGIYVWNDKINLAVDVALATGRPLLLRGATGSGKSSLAMAEAKKRGWRYYEQTITSRTQARELLWEVDQLARFHEARRSDGDDPLPVSRYVRPGILWWAINRESALGYATAEKDPNFNRDRNGKRVEHERAVVLLDEIDKADPDVPNNLLVPLGSYRFQIDESMEPIQLERGEPPLIIITSNGERELPPAFLRRCVEYFIEDADEDRLLTIAKKHFPTIPRQQLKGMFDAIVAARPSDWNGPALPSPAEFIDCINAIGNLTTVTPAEIARLVVWKSSASERTV
ncbi:MAG TPA: MoxR family ATPase [Thermoanaerobaculia bacterium]|nr:MoxR family ATPase [Thermoanaerobaculia bacterium]